MKKAIVLVMVVLMMTAVIGCSKEESVSNETVVIENEDVNVEVQVTKVEEQVANTEEVENKTLAYYAGLIGMGRESLIEKMNEEPTVVDEGGLEFEKGGFRAWFFGDNGTVDQLYFFDQEIDYNGAKVGDSIDVFEEKFGEPTVLDLGSSYMNFDYEGYVLNVTFDESSVVRVVYLLTTWE